MNKLLWAVGLSSIAIYGWILISKLVLAPPEERLKIALKADIIITNKTLDEPSILAAIERYKSNDLDVLVKARNGLKGIGFINASKIFEEKYINLGGDIRKLT